MMILIKSNLFLSNEVFIFFILFWFSNNDSNNHNNKVIPVTIVSWSCTDRSVATAYENGLIKVWEPNNGTLLNELKVNLLIWLIH